MSLYRPYNNKNEIMGMEKEQKAPFCLEFINNIEINRKMNIMHVKIKHLDNKEQSKILYKEYQSSIMKVEEENIKEILRKYDCPVFIKFNSSSFKQGSSALDTYWYRAKIYFYTYKRYSFIKKVNKLKNNLESKRIELADIPENIFNYFSIHKLNKEILSHQNELDKFIGAYINNYITWLRDKFNVLHLPVDLFEELHQHILLSSNDNLEKTCIVLDEIVEKIELFHFKAKKITVKNGYQLLIESSVEDFTKYIQLKINVLQDFNILTSYGDSLETVEKEDMVVLEKLKNDIFKEN